VEGHLVLDLAGKVAIVTGGSRGIGAAAAAALATAGAAVVLVGRDGVAAERAAEAITALGGHAYGVGCDIADFPSVEKVVVEVEQRFGPPAILVNNAGVIEPIGPLASSDPAAWRRNIEINLIGAYNAVSAMPRMLDANGGTVINVSSGAAHRPQGGPGDADERNCARNRPVLHQGVRPVAGSYRYRHAGPDPCVRHQSHQPDTARRTRAGGAPCPCDRLSMYRGSRRSGGKRIIAPRSRVPRRIGLSAP
jgi:NAD(P)-dependent dehydrogenase (short-subunit alcohol dehydrogenase family)